jgi:hypothetical protein
MQVLGGIIDILLCFFVIVMPQSWNTFRSKIFELFDSDNSVEGIR